MPDHPQGISRRSLVLAAAAVAAGQALPMLCGGVASGSAQSDGTPAASATPATSDSQPVVERIGRGGALQVVREQEPRYVSAQKRGGSLTMARPTPDKLSFNPAALQPDPQVVLSYLEPLLRPDPVSMEPKPWLALGWEWGADHLSVRLPLRTDVVWHDGSPFTAADVAYSLLALRDDPSSVVANFLASVKDVTAVDAHTALVTLSEIDGNLPLNALTQPIFQRAQFEQAAGGSGLADVDWNGMIPLGTGPWRIDQTHEAGVELARNDRYWGERAWLDAVSISWVAGEARRLSAWADHQTDLLWPVRASDIRALGPRPGRLYAADAASVLFAAFNFANPNGPVPDLFAAPDVRRALSLAIDRERYAREVFGGFANVAAVGTVAQPWAHDAALANPAHDPSQAAALLNGQGWSDINGDGILEDAQGVPFIIKAVLESDLRPELARVLARVKDDLLQVGVVLNIVPLEAGALNEALTSSRDFDLVAYTFDLYPGFTDWDLYGTAWAIDRNPLGWNPGSYSNPAADEAIDGFLGSTTIDEQRTALVALQQAVDDDLFGLWLGFPQSLVAVSADLDGFQPDKTWQTALTERIWRPDRPKPTPTPAPSAPPVPAATRGASATATSGQVGDGGPATRTPAGPSPAAVSDSGDVSDASVPAAGEWRAGATPQATAPDVMQHIP